MSNNRIFENFLKQVDKGRAGGNKWIPLGLGSLDDHIGLGKKMYYLVGGEPGTGKTALVDQLFVLQPYEWYMRNRDKTDKKLRIIYRSMERSSEHKIAKWTCRYLWMKYRILVDVKTIFGWGFKQSRIPDGVYEKVVEARDYFERMFDVVHITDGADNPTGVYKQCLRISWNEGTLIKSNDEAIKQYNHQYTEGKVMTRFTMENWEETVSGRRYFEEICVEGRMVKIYQYHTEFFEQDPDIINVLIEDHAGKFKSERGFNDKQTLDKASEYNGELRDIYHWSPVVVSQFNRSISNVSRRTKLDLAPEKQDFKGTANIYEDADFVVGLFSPHENSINNFKGYRIPAFKSAAGFNRFRSLHVLKNSYGIDILVKALSLLGEVGHFYDLPHHNQLSDQAMYYFANPCQHPELKDQALKLTA